MKPAPNFEQINPDVQRIIRARVNTAKTIRVYQAELTALDRRMEELHEDGLVPTSIRHPEFTLSRVISQRWSYDKQTREAVKDVQTQAQASGHAEKVPSKSAWRLEWK